MMGVIAILVIGDTVGIKTVADWVQNVAVTATMILGAVTLLILQVFDTV
jgi:hypothetical protein